MKINRPALKLVRTFVVKDIIKRRPYYPSKEQFKCWLDVPYLDDHNKYHTYDVYLADPKIRKRVCFIDIHGGAYLFGEHQDNYPYAYMLLEAGFDVVLMDYEPNNGKKDIVDLLNDVATNFKHLHSHLKEYDLDKDIFVMTGDSAGGHMSFLFSLMMQNEDINKELGFDVPNFKPIATILSCPVYDYANMGVGSLTNRALELMIGPKYKDKAHLANYSPKTYVSFNKIPLFLSTCTRDFIRSESLALNKDMENKPGYKFIDINSNKKEVDHVHNVVKINLEESKIVNHEIIKFVDNLL